ncbi:MAG: hypothetical protein WCQ76_05880 [Fusobacterium sp.]|jgi:hypothetical protein
MKNEIVKRVITELKINKIIENKYYKLMDLRNICTGLNQDRLDYKIDKKYFKRLYAIIKNKLEIEENEMINLYSKFYENFKTIKDFSLFFGVSVAAVRKWNLDKSDFPYYVFSMILKENEINKLKLENQKLKNKIIENITHSENNIFSEY